MQLRSDTDTFHKSLHPTQRTQRKERNGLNEMTSLLDRPITAASDDGVAAGTLPSCGRHARQNMKPLK